MFGAGVTIWNSTFIDCPNGRSDILLRHSRYNMDPPPHEECNHEAVIARSVGIFDNQCYISQLTVIIGEEMISRTIECSVENSIEGITTTVAHESLMVTQTPYPPL